MNTLMVLILYFVLINLSGFCAMRNDKMRAKKRVWRIPESTLFSLALIGGSIGCIAGMYVFHHKTRHITFVLGMPLILILQIVGLLLLYTHMEIRLL